MEDHPAIVIQLVASSQVKLTSTEPIDGKLLFSLFNLDELRATPEKLQRMNDLILATLEYWNENGLVSAKDSDADHGTANPGQSNPGLVDMEITERLFLRSISEKTLAYAQAIEELLRRNIDEGSHPIWNRMAHDWPMFRARIEAHIAKQGGE